MKNLVKTAVVILSLPLVGFLAGCKKSAGRLGAAACGKNVEAYTKASQDFSNSPTKANCEKLKNEAIKFLESCPSFYTGEQKQAIENIRNSSCD